MNNDDYSTVQAPQITWDDLEWFPIEIAPKDGSPFLAIARNYFGMGEWMIPQACRFGYSNRGFHEWCVPHSTPWGAHDPLYWTFLPSPPQDAIRNAPVSAPEAPIKTDQD